MDIISQCTFFNIVFWGSLVYQFSFSHGYCFLWSQESLPVPKQQSWWPVFCPKNFIVLVFISRPIMHLELISMFKVCDTDCGWLFLHTDRQYCSTIYWKYSAKWIALEAFVTKNQSVDNTTYKWKPTSVLALSSGSFSL